MEGKTRPTARRKSKPQKSSWTVRRRFRYPDLETARQYRKDFELAMREHCADFRGFSFAPGERKIIPNRVFQALLFMIDNVELPVARYTRWSRHGKMDGPSPRIVDVLRRCGADEELAEHVAEALMQIEPYPSKKPIERYLIRQLLGEVGDLWPEENRPYLERAEH